jgi:hypothetical protein
MTLFMIGTIEIRHLRVLFMNYSSNVSEIIKKAGI